MRKQTDFAYRQIEYSSIDPQKSSPVWSAWIRDNYLSQGWEVLSSEVVRAEANSVFLGLSFVKYEEVADEVREEVETVKRGPGRPPKAESEASASS